jgi:hypothetical protein
MDPVRDLVKQPAFSHARWSQDRHPGVAVEQLNDVTQHRLAAGEGPAHPRLTEIDEVSAALVDILPSPTCACRLNAGQTPGVSETFGIR